jgi:hypothetical protein
MRRTIKYKFLKLMKGKGTLRRKDVCLLVFKAQGKKGKEAQEYREGYYGTNLQSWVRDGLLEQPNGKGYRLTKAGIRYLSNPEAEHHRIKAKQVRQRLNNISDYHRDLYKEVRELRQKVAKIDRVING